jgi:hypothetical protein
MSREEVRKLLGGYATGTLTPAEQEALFAASLEDQELFDALAAEQSMRDLLRDPAVQAELLAALDGGPPKQPWWQWRPLVAGVAMAGMAAIGVGTWLATREKPAPVVVAELRKEAPPESRGQRPESRGQGSGAGGRGTEGREPARSRGPSRRGREPEAGGRDYFALVPGRVSVSSGNVAGSAGVVGGVPQAPPPAITAEAPVVAESKPAEMALPKSPAIMEFQGKGDNVPRFGAVAPPPPPQGRIASASARQQQSAAPPPSQQGQQGSSVDAGPMMMKSAIAPLQVTILREKGEFAPGTILYAGETVRLRLEAPADGDILIEEGGKTIASASVLGSKPYDTPPLPFEGAGRRELAIRFSAAASKTVQPLTMRITLVYR